MLDDDDKKKRRDNNAGNDFGNGGDGDGPEDNNKNPKGVDFKSSRFVILIVLGGLVTAIVFGTKFTSSFNGVNPDWTEFRNMVAAGKFSKIVVDGRVWTGTFIEGQPAGPSKSVRTAYAVAPSERLND